MEQQYYPGRPYRLPYDRQEMLDTFWPPRTAARAWGVSYPDALRYMLAHPEWCAWVRVQRANGRIEWVYCVSLDLIREAEG